MSEETAKTPNGVSGNDKWPFVVGTMEFAPNTKEFLKNNPNASGANGNAGDAILGDDDTIVIVTGESRVVAMDMQNLINNSMNVKLEGDEKESREEESPDKDDIGKE